MGNLTRGNLLATLKELKKHKRPKAVVANVAVQAICPQKPNSKSSALKEVIAKRREILCRGLNKPFYILSTADILLLNRLVTLHDYRTPYNGEPYGELFIHWFYRDRKKDSLSRCEIFHLNMLQYFNVMDKVKVIHVRCAAKCPMSGAMQRAVEILSCGKATVDFKVVPQQNSWEYDTFKECVEFASNTGEFVYYTHFKGVSRIGDDTLGMGCKYVKNSTDLDILYWGYLMYSCLFGNKITANAIGPIRTNNHRLLKVYSDNSWTRNVVNNQDFFYRGSFQGFSGIALNENLKELGVSLEKTLPVGTHTVELWLSAIFKESEIYSLPFTSHSMNTPGYHEFTQNVFPLHKNLFKAAYTVVDTLVLSRIVVSMTSWKARIGNVYAVIQSLLNQCRVPNSIELNLAVTEFPNKEKDLPLDLQKLVDDSSLVHINWVETDTNVFKKIIPTLQKYMGEEYIMLSVDDDIIYDSAYIVQMLCLLGDADVACADIGYVGFKSIFRSSVFSPDFWELLTDSVVSCRVDDTYITEYLKRKNAVCVYEPRKEILSLLHAYNPVSPNSSFLNGYSAEKLRNAECAIREALKL